MYCKSAGPNAIKCSNPNVVRKGSRTYGCVCISTNVMTPAWSSIRKQTNATGQALVPKITCNGHAFTASAHLDPAKNEFLAKNKQTHCNKFVARYQHVCISQSNRRRFNVPARVKLSKMKTFTGNRLKWESNCDTYACHAMPCSSCRVVFVLSCCTQVNCKTVCSIIGTRPRRHIVIIIAIWSQMYEWRMQGIDNARVLARST